MTIPNSKKHITAGSYSKQWFMASMIALAGTVAATTVKAQTNGSNSPYSRYGFGLLSDRAQGFNKGMSGLAYGMRGGSELNTKTQRHTLPSIHSRSSSMPAFLFKMPTLNNAVRK